MEIGMKIGSQFMNWQEWLAEIGTKAYKHNILKTFEKRFLAKETKDDSIFLLLFTFTSRRSLVRISLQQQHVNHQREDPTRNL